MSHAIDIDGIQEKLFVIRHLCHGTEKYCIRDKIQTELDLSIDFFDGYWGKLKVLLSNNLIEIAAKVRMIEEFCNAQGYSDLLKELEDEAIGKRKLGSVSKGKFRLTLREAANKIIHSTHAEVNFKNFSYLNTQYLCWDGAYEMHGKHGQKEWTVVLDIESWAICLSNFLRLLEENELTFSMGQN